MINKPQKIQIEENVLWIEPDLETEENIKNNNDLKAISNSLNFQSFKNVDEAIDHLKSIKFQETYIIIRDKIFSELIKYFKENLDFMYIIPKIIIFSKDKKNFIKNNKDFKNEDNKFYQDGGIETDFNEIKNIISSIKIREIIPKTKERKLQDLIVEFTFEYIDSKEKLMLPLMFKSLIEKTSYNNMQKYTLDLYTKYGKNHYQLKNLFESLKNTPKIPFQLLSKYCAKLYTAETDFYKNINKDLIQNKTENYLPFIKILYEGAKLKSLPLAGCNKLYRGSLINNIEIEKIKKYLNNKKDDLPAVIVFSKPFLSFSKDLYVAKCFLSGKKEQENLSKILFILEKDDNIDYNLATHCDLENISFYKDEKEVLFFPFSAFEIKDLRKKIDGGITLYEIKLLYLGKYLKDIEKDKDIIEKTDKITDSKFKKELSDFGIIKKEEIININNKQLFNKFKLYNNDNNNFDNNNNKNDNSNNDNYNDDNNCDNNHNNNNCINEEEKNNTEKNNNFNDTQKSDKIKNNNNIKGKEEINNYQNLEIKDAQKNENMNEFLKDKEQMNNDLFNEKNNIQNIEKMNDNNINNEGQINTEQNNENKDIQENLNNKKEEEKKNIEQNLENKITPKEDKANDNNINEEEKNNIDENNINKNIEKLNKMNEAKNEEKIEISNDEKMDNTINKSEQIIKEQNNENKDAEKKETTSIDKNEQENINTYLNNEKDEIKKDEKMNNNFNDEKQINSDLNYENKNIEKIDNNNINEEEIINSEQNKENKDNQNIEKINNIFNSEKKAI